jgi:hypothetical protein
LTFRYALSATGRPLKLTINDAVRIASIPFPASGAWNVWTNYATNQTLNAGVNSIMLTAISTSGGNFDELTISGNGISAIQNLKNTNDKSLKIYPNPLKSGKFFINLNGFENSTAIQLKIENLLGQTVYSEKAENIAMIELNTVDLQGKSIYLVSVEADNTKITQKLVLN